MAEPCSAAAGGLAVCLPLVMLGMASPRLHELQTSPPMTANLSSQRASVAPVTPSRAGYKFHSRRAAPAGLFFYDIFWVFCTPVMVSVAKSFDAPIKLLFPRGLDEVGGGGDLVGVGGKEVISASGRWASGQVGRGAGLPCSGREGPAGRPLPQSLKEASAAHAALVFVHLRGMRGRGRPSAAAGSCGRLAASAGPGPLAR